VRSLTSVEIVLACPAGYSHQERAAHQAAKGSAPDLVHGNAAPLLPAVLPRPRGADPRGVNGHAIVDTSPLRYKASRGGSGAGTALLSGRGVTKLGSAPVDSGGEGLCSSRGSLRRVCDPVAP